MKALIIILIVIAALFLLTFLVYLANADSKLIEKIYNWQIKKQDAKHVEEKI